MTPGNVRPRPLAGLWGIALSVAVLLAGGWALTLERVEYEREEAVQSAYRETANLALAFEQDVQRTLEALDMAMRFTHYEVARGGMAGDLKGVFSTLDLDQGPFTTLSVTDERGIIVASTGPLDIDLSDRPYFQFHRAEPSGRPLRVDAPVLGRVSGRPAIPVSRRTDHPDGRFGGIVLAGIAPTYFTDFFQRVRLGEGGLIQIVGTDGIVRARRSGSEVSWGGDLSTSTLIERGGAAESGSFESAGRLDGVARFMSYRRVAGADLLVTVGVPVDEALATFVAHRRTYYAFASAGSVIVLLFGAALLLVNRRQARTLKDKRRADEAYRQTFDRAPVGIAHQAMDGRYIKVNRALCDMLGYTEAELLGRSFLDLLHPEDAAAARALILEHEAGEPWPPVIRVENRHVRKDGSTMWGAASLSVVEAREDAPAYVLAMVEDVTARRRAEAALEESRRRFQDLVDNTNDFIWELDTESRFVYASHNVSKLLGYDPEAILGKRPFDLMPPEEGARTAAWFESVRAARKPFAALESRLVDRAGRVRVWETNGAPILHGSGEVRGYRGVSRDITERKRTEEQLEREAHYDRITGLPNRALCFDRMKQLIASAQRHRRYAGVMLLDLDRFKSINDTLGHAVGDAVLRSSAERLARCVRSGDTVARIGGDEFVILLQDLQQAQDAALVAKKVLAVLQRPIVEGGHEVFATASIGIAICPPDGQVPETLLANADAALSRAKKAGRATFQFYTAEMNARAADQLALERDLRRALERNELSLHYQPKANIAERHVVGFEALLRWTRGGAAVSPGAFIPILEESGLIREVGAWVLDEACRQAAAWRAAGLTPLPVAINVSAKQLNAELQPIVERALLDHGLDARLLRIEITESDAMVDPERALAVLRGLKDIGIALSIDDFGTGYSSLSYLKRFQPAELKLDRSFVSGLPDNADDVSITKAVISMAHSLGMKVVAEGVETEAQRDFLRGHGCDQMQGYLFSRPVPAAQAVAFLRRAGETARAPETI